MQFYAKRSCKKHAGRSEEEDGPSEKPQEIGCYVQKCAVICAITEDVNLSWDGSIIEKLKEMLEDYLKKTSRNIIMDRISYDSYKIDIESVDPAKDLSMREVYGLDPAMAK